MEFNCRHCGRISKPPGFWKHLRTHPEALDYKGELRAHGVSMAKGLWVKVGTPAPTPELRHIMNPPDNGRLTITREALALALSGLERVKGELEGHIADVKATLNPPLQRKMGRPKKAEAPFERAPGGGWAPKREESAAPIMARWINKGGITKKVWSNDPEGKYRHNRETGEIIMNPLTGGLSIKPKTTPASIAAMAKARAVLKQQRRKGIK